MHGTTPPILLFVVGLGVVAAGAWQGMHVLRLRVDGVRANGVVLRHESRESGSGRRRHSERWTILRVAEHECAVPGEEGTLGTTVPVHHAIGRPTDCALDSGVALRGAIFTAVPGLLMLILSYYGFQRARGSG